MGEPNDATAMRLDGFGGRTAAVTGASRGIGRRIAETLVAQGAQTVALDLEAPTIEGATSLVCDVSSNESIASAFAEIEREVGPVSILVANAGVLLSASLEETTLEIWNRTLSVNLYGAFFCINQVLPKMRQDRYGRILTIGSSAGITGGARHAAAYGSSKAALMTLTKAIANEYGAYGITANTLAPALIETTMIADFPDMRSQIPVGHYGTVDDVAAAAAFLCSSHAGYITAEVLDINGGFLIN